MPAGAILVARVVALAHIFAASFPVTNVLRGVTDVASNSHLQFQAL